MTNIEQDSANPPDLDSSGKARRRAITSGDQAFSIAEKMVADQKTRNDYEAIVDRKYNGDLPFNQAALINAGEAWRNNFSTGFMSGIIGKVIPEPVKIIDNARYLTASKICQSYEDFQSKTEFLRDNITQTIRQWNEWKNFQYGLWTEVILHGNAIVANLNPYSPWPEMYRTDRAFIPIGTGQHAGNIPMAVLMKDYLVHEFVEFIWDKGIAEDAGWDTEAAIKAVEEALPKQKPTDQQRTYEDAVREGNPGSAYSGAKVISVYHVLAVEPDTRKVTHYIINRNGKHEVLFQKDDRFDRMEDVITLFTLEPGNGTFYGSKGMGRMMLNMSIACETNRCLLFDQLRLAGMNIFKTDATKSPTMQLRVRHPFLVVSGDGEIQQQPIKPNIEAFIQADDQLSRWAEQLVGAYISDLHGEDAGPHPTATEEQIRAQREQQFKIAFLARAYGQHSELISIMQKRLLDKETTDEFAKTLQDRVKEEGILPEDIEDFLKSSSAEISQDLSTSQNQAIIQAYSIFNGDPAFDQYKLKDMVASAMVSPQFAKDVLLDEQGVQANEIEAFQKATGENEDMIDGASHPVSPRDPHEQHIKNHLGEVQKGLGVLAKTGDPKTMDAINIMLRHVEDGHIKTWEQSGATPAQLKPYKDAAKMFERGLAAMAKAVQEKQQQAQNSTQGAQTAPGPQNAPTGAPAAPEQPSPIHPEEHMLKITSSIAYKDAPESIKRQIEAAAGFQPADTATALKERATTTIKSHPNLPVQAETEHSAALPVEPITK